MKSSPFNVVETHDSFQIGRNILLLNSSDVRLHKTSKYKAKLVLIDFLTLLLFVTVTAVIIKINQPLRWPKDILDWLSFGGLTIIPVYYLVSALHATFNECQTYRIVQTHNSIILNGKVFAHQLETSLLVKKKVGWQGLGVAYQIRLNGGRNRKVLSCGNSLDEAIDAATLISKQLGIPIETDRG